MKVSILIKPKTFLFFLVVLSVSKGALALWVSGTDPRLRIEGLAWHQENRATSQPYARLPLRIQNWFQSLNPVAWDESLRPSGGLIRFVSDTGTFRIRVLHDDDRLELPHMPRTGVSGLDLYVNGQYRGTSRAQSGRETYEHLYFSEHEKRLREFSLYLPTYAGLVGLEIEIEDDASISAPRQHTHPLPIVVYGTSITQSGCASRGANGFVPRIGRMLDVETINLGFSGSGTGDPELAEIISEIDASIFVIDSVANIVEDPSNSQNKVLKISSPHHTDGTVLRSSAVLPKQYKICLRVGHPNFGTGKISNLNGYSNKNKMATPWVNASSINENGFYWLAILFGKPRPRNNVWIHHHRKIVIDSDNNDYPKEDGSSGSWTHIWNGHSFIQSGIHPVMIFALDKEHKESVWNYDRTGQPFISLASGKWNSEAQLQQIRAADAYLGKEWYRTCVWKTKTKYGVSVSGKFQYGGKTTYSNEIPREQVFHGDEDIDYFMAGDPHINFYEGSVLYDDIELYELQE